MRSVRIATIALAVVLPATAVAQVPVRTLAAPDARSAESFTAVTGFRELRDGRVLVSDARDQRLVALDLRSGAVTSVGRVGAGPAEWGRVSRLHAMAGDSTLMSDPTNDRFLLILPDGKPGPTFRIDDTSPAAYGTLVGLDARGRMILERERPTVGDPRAGSTGIVDILRYDRATTRVDTLARLAIPKGEFSGVRTRPGGMLESFTNLPLAPRDVSAVSAVARGGRLAIVRADGYRVEWIAADGARVTGARAAASGIRVTTAEKQAYVDAQLRPGAIITRVQDADRLAGAAAGAGSNRPPGGAIAIPRGTIDPNMTWPEIKPPFVAGAALVAPDGRLWVLRTRAHDDPIPSFDVFNEAGVVVERVRIPARTRLIGFGRTAVYLARTDDDDLVTVERYRVP